MSLHLAVSQFFEWETRVVTRWPLLFITIPLIFTISIISLAIYDPQLNTSKQSLEMFLPDQMESLIHLHELMQLFPPRNALRDSYSLFGSKFAYVIYEDTTEDGNILTEARMKDVADVHKNVKNVVTDKYLKYSDLCYREETNGSCLMHPILYALEDSQALLATQFMARYPFIKISNATIDNAVVFGGVTLSNKTVDKHGNRPIEKARAVRLVYVLAPVNEADEWINQFTKAMKNLRYEDANIFFTTSKALPDEMQRNGELLIPWMPWMVAILIIFCALICFTSDCIRSQPFIGLSAMFNAFLAVCGAIATLIYVEYPFLHMILIMPFLIISIGVDNMFLMLKSWRLACDCYRGRLSKASESDEVLVYAITEVSVSLMITSLTDGFSFLVGSLSDFIAVRVFCVYCSLAILYMFIFQITLLTGLMVLHCRREVVKRNCLTFLKSTATPKSYEEVYKQIARCKYDDNSTFSGFGLKPSSGENLREKSDIWSILTKFYQKKAVKFLGLICYMAYLAVALNYLLQLPLGLDLKLLTPDNSYAALEIRAQERLFADYGAFCFAVIKTKKLALHKMNERAKMIRFYHILTKGGLVSPGEFWLEQFANYTEDGDFHTEKLFMKTVIRFLEDERYSKYRSDIKFGKNGTIEAIKMIMRIRKLGAENDPPRAAWMRRLFKNSNYDGFVYDTSFLLVDQQATTLQNVIANVAIAVLVMLTVAILLIPRPVSALAIALCIISINVGVVGGLSAVGTRLDIISMITIVMSIGFSVDYATHITFHYLISQNDRLKQALEVVAFPIIQAATSTLVGVAILGVVPSYMIRTFVLTVVFVVLIGLVHAIFFLPILLDTVVPDTEFIRAYEAPKPVFSFQKPVQSMAFQKTPYSTIKRLDCYIEEKWKF